MCYEGGQRGGAALKGTASRFFSGEIRGLGIDALSYVR